MFKTIIIDDIDSVRAQTRTIINTYCPEVEIIAEANSVASGLDAILKYNPNLVFLDVELGNETSFDLLKKLNKIDFKVIFVTAYQDYAVQAFRSSAIDFLLKPIDPYELKEAITKAKNAIENESFALKMSTLFANTENISQIKRLIVKTTDKVHSIAVKDIVRCESDKNYTSFHLANGDVLLASTTLKEFDQLLTPSGFFRSHQSHLINIDFFDYYLKTDGGCIIMKDKSNVPLASRKKEELFTLLKKLQ